VRIFSAKIAFAHASPDHKIFNPPTLTERHLFFMSFARLLDCQKSFVIVISSSSLARLAILVMVFSLE
jgi:hypothetical protein